MRTFILVLCLGIVAIYNIAGAVGVGAWLLCLGAFAVGCFWGWLQSLNSTTSNTDVCDVCPGTDDLADTDGEEEQLSLLLALIALVDPYTTEPGAVEYSLCSQAYGACTTTPADTDGDNA